MKTAYQKTIASVEHFLRGLKEEDQKSSKKAQKSLSKKRSYGTLRQ